MRTSRQLRIQMRLASSSFVVLFLIIVALLLALSRQYHRQFDWTESGRNSLSPASVALLKKLPKPITITAFVTDKRNLRMRISELVERYKEHDSRIKLEFVNPDKHPGRVRDAGIRFDGELLVDYGGRTQTVEQINEQALTNAIARAGRGGDRQVVFLSGQGERSPDGNANFDLSTWAMQMNKRGLKTRSLTLGETGQIPADTSVLVIASPTARFLPGEVKELENYIHRGGNLLWLSDPGTHAGLTPLADMLGVVFQPGVIVDPVSQLLTGGQSATDLVVTRYGEQPVVRGFNLMTLFPDARGITFKAPKHWQGQVIIDTSPTAWSAIGPLGKVTSFRKGRDIPGPLDIAVALTRQRAKRQQRIAIIGNGNFLSNTFIGNGGNLDLGMNLINWLANDEAYINVPARIAPDLRLDLSRTAEAAIGIGFLVVLPLILLMTGIGIWLRRRKR
ncbi:MAG: GldG family protein [Gammaproteobacteria bacterium]|nr:GldG family protein [Gammaproteobacteria bacterium]